LKPSTESDWNLRAEIEPLPASRPPLGRVISASSEEIVRDVALGDSVDRRRIQFNVRESLFRIRRAHELGRLSSAAKDTLKTSFLTFQGIDQLILNRMDDADAQCIRETHRMLVNELDQRGVYVIFMTNYYDANTDAMRFCSFFIKNNGGAFSPPHARRLVEHGRPTESIYACAVRAITNGLHVDGFSAEMFEDPSLFKHVNKPGIDHVFIANMENWEQYSKTFQNMTQFSPAEFNRRRNALIRAGVEPAALESSELKLVLARTLRGNEDILDIYGEAIENISISSLRNCILPCSAEIMQQVTFFQDYQEFRRKAEMQESRRRDTEGDRTRAGNGRIGGFRDAGAVNPGFGGISCMFGGFGAGASRSNGFNIKR
jgi:hypothetical protein